jgi:uncharacterized cofD-like protein
MTNGRGRTRWRSWLRPGVGIKRWLLVVLLGELLLAVGLVVFIRQQGRAFAPGTPGDSVISLVSLQFLPDWARPLLLLAAGAVVVGFGLWRFMRAVVEPYAPSDTSLVDDLYQRRARARGPRVVAIGGGTGLSTLLRGLKEVTSNITAVVTVADDGGSSGRLRDELGVPPMGDIRNCIVALADAEPQMAELLQYRFPANGNDDAFKGHALGNLLIAALTDVAGGDFEEGVRLSNRVLAVRGSVVPVAPVPLILHAELADGTTMDGQSEIMRTRGIRRVWVTPGDVRAADEAVDAIAAADLVIYGPGSLYTSILPSLLVPGMREALERTPASRLFVCNVATQVGETEGFTLADHMAAFRVHGLDTAVDAVLLNNNFRARVPENYPAAPVRGEAADLGRSGPQVFLRDVVDDNNAHRHSSSKLAAAISLLHERHVIRRRAAPAVAPAQVAA